MNRIYDDDYYERWVSGKQSTTKTFILSKCLFVIWLTFEILLTLQDTTQMLSLLDISF